MLMRSKKIPDLSQTDRKLSLIGVASALGCPKKGSEQGPLELLQLGLTNTLQLCGIDAHWQQIIHAKHQQTDLNALALLCEELARTVKQQVEHQQFFSVIGGDHSCAIGTWNGVYQARQHAPFGLIWVDAHMDSHTPFSSHTGALHGMPLACLLGFGDQALTGLAKPGPALQAEHLCLIGVRSFEAEEAELLANLGVRVFDMHEIRERGMDTVMAEAIDIAGSAGDFGLSIDLDALDPTIAPAISIPEPNGINLHELNRLIKPLAKTAGLIGVEIAEFNPRFDHQQQTARLISTILSACVPAPPDK